MVAGLPTMAPMRLSMASTMGPPGWGSEGAARQAADTPASR